MKYERYVNAVILPEAAPLWSMLKHFLKVCFFLLLNKPSVKATMVSSRVFFSLAVFPHGKT
jgi:hypothetical protein